MTASLRSSGFRESRRVLIVDHHAEATASLRLLLESKGHTVCVSPSAREALAEFSNFAPHVALVDAALPDADGYDLAHVLRAQAGLEQCRVIAGAGMPPSSFAAHLVLPQNADELFGLIDESGGRESAAR